MKNSIWILALLFSLSFACTAQGQNNKPPRCDRCKDACQFAEDIDELEMNRFLYQNRSLRLEAARTRSHDPVNKFNQIVKRELNKWGGGRKCKEKPPAYTLMSANTETCEIDERDSREKLCETRFNYYMNHERHHAEWCKAGKERIENGDNSHSYADFNTPCYAMWLEDRNDAKETRCNLKVVNAHGDEEVAAYDQALLEARMALKDLYEKCGMTKSVEAIEKEIEDDAILKQWLSLAARIEDLYLLLEGDI